MTVEEYIEQQTQAFHKVCEDMNFSEKWQGNLTDIKRLDEARDCAIKELWPEGTPKEIGDAAAIMWGVMFSKAIAGSYISKWAVDPESSTPVVIVKCGTKGTRVKALIVGAQSFNNGNLFTDTWAELEKELSEAGAEKA